MGKSSLGATLTSRSGTSLIGLLIGAGMSQILLYGVANQMTQLNRNEIQIRNHSSRDSLKTLLRLAMVNSSSCTNTFAGMSTPFNQANEANISFRLGSTLVATNSPLPSGHKITSVKLKKEEVLADRKIAGIIHIETDSPPGILRSDPFEFPFLYVTNDNGDQVKSCIGGTTSNASDSTFSDTLGKKICSWLGGKKFGLTYPIYASGEIPECLMTQRPMSDPYDGVNAEGIRADDEILRLEKESVSLEAPIVRGGEVRRKDGVRACLSDGTNCPVGGNPYQKCVNYRILSDVPLTSPSGAPGAPPWLDLNFNGQTTGPLYPFKDIAWGSFDCPEEAAPNYTYGWRITRSKVTPVANSPDWERGHANKVMGKYHKAGTLFYGLEYTGRTSSTMFSVIVEATCCQMGIR